MIVAVILSAGESSRMGRPKALLPIEGQTFIERIVGAHDAVFQLKASHPPRIGSVVILPGEIEATVIERNERFFWLARPF